MWCLTAPGVVVHRIRDDKSAATFAKLVGEYQGMIVCDAVKTHDAGLARDRASCSPAAGRTCTESSKRRSRIIPKRVERSSGSASSTRSTSAPGRSRVARRAASHRVDCSPRRDQGVAVVASRAQVALDRQGRGLRDRQLGEAHALRRRRPHPARQQRDRARHPRSSRRPTNHYGSKSRRGTEVAATLYSILETAKLHGIDPRDVPAAAVRAADRGEVLMPWDFAASS